MIQCYNGSILQQSTPPNPLKNYLPGNPTAEDRQQWELVLNDWESYRDLIGLEGSLYLNLLEKGKSEDTILKIDIELHRQERKASLPTFSELISRRK